MNRVVGPLLAGLGAFLLALAVLLPTVVVPRFEEVPLDQYTVSRAEGTATYLNTQTFEFVDDDTVTITRVNRADVDDSSDNVAMFDSTQTVETGSMTEPLNVVEERVRFDRETGLGVGGRGDRPDHEDTYVLKLPFNTEKTDYLLWEATAEAAFPVSFVRETEIRGLDVYEFSGTVPETVRDEVGVPARLLGADNNLLIFSEEVYENPNRTIFVEPRTGSIVSTTSSPRRFFRPVELGAVSEGAQETTIFEAEVEATEETQAELVADAKDSRDQLNLYGRTLPIVLGLLGALLLLGGIALSAASRRRRRTEYVTGEHAATY